MTPAHTLSISSIEDGYTHWQFACHHDPDDPAWAPRTPGYWRLSNGVDTWVDGEVIPPRPGEKQFCWLHSWWEGCGQELVDIKQLPPFMLAVGPDDDWDYEDGGRIVLSEGT